ncbi:MAG: carboxyl transferase domain-containing protein [Eubacteriales bacterium]|nr:carboxyl transferase domain-containing protein [Eubacteriales bacterium]
MSSTSKARQRVQSLLDANSFVEIGARVKARATDFNTAPAGDPSDGVITGYGLIGGRLVYVYSQDADVLGGSIGEMHARKIVNLYHLAMRTGAPVIGLIDSAGLRLQEGVDALEAFGAIYAEQAKASGVIPQISAIFGNCGGGLALFPAMTDFSLMEADAHLFVSSPNALAGNREESDNTASAASKAASGNVDFVGTQEEIFGQIRFLIDMLPSNNEDEAAGECTDDLNRECPSAAAFVEDPRAAMFEIADGGLFFEMKKEYAKEMVTGLACLGGNTVGIIANRSAVFDEEGKKAEEFGGALTSAGCAKAAAMVRFCDAFEIPVITLTNASGFAATKEEENSVAAAAASLTAAFAGATVPKINVITKRAGGSAYAVMNSKALGADLTFAYPDSTVGILEGKFAAPVLCDGSSEELRETAAAYDALQNSVDSAAARGYVDQVITPADIRKYLIGAVEVLFSKREALPSRKHASI